MGCVVCCAGCYLSVLCAGCTGVTKPFTWDALCVVQDVICLLCRLYGCNEASYMGCVVCCAGCYLPVLCAGCTGVTKPVTWDVLCVVQVIVYLFFVQVVRV